MRKPINRSGQSLVELACLLPFVFFFFLICAQLLMILRLQVTLHHSAMKSCSVAAYDAPSRAKLLMVLALDLGSTWRWGLPDPVQSSVQEEPLEGWKRYPGFGTTINTPPKLVTTQAAYQLYPHLFFGRFVWARTLMARSSLPEEIGQVGS